MRSAATKGLIIPTVAQGVRYADAPRHVDGAQNTISVCSIGRSALWFAVHLDSESDRIHSYFDREQIGATNAQAETWTAAFTGVLKFPVADYHTRQSRLRFAR